MHLVAQCTHAARRTARATGRQGAVAFSSSPARSVCAGDRARGWIMYVLSGHVLPDHAGGLAAASGASPQKPRHCRSTRDLAGDGASAHLRQEHAKPAVQAAAHPPPGCLPIPRPWAPGMGRHAGGGMHLAVAGCAAAWTAGSACPCQRSAQAPSLTSEIPAICGSGAASEVRLLEQWVDLQGGGAGVPAEYTIYPWARSSALTD